MLITKKTDLSGASIIGQVNSKASDSFFLVKIRGISGGF
jgi:hypothetical protein